MQEMEGTFMFLIRNAGKNVWPGGVREIPLILSQGIEMKMV